MNVRKRLEAQEKSRGPSSKWPLVSIVSSSEGDGHVASESWQSAHVEREVADLPAYLSALGAADVPVIVDDIPR